MQPIDYFRRAVSRFPERTALEEDAGRTGFAALGTRVDALAAALQEAVPAPAGRIGIMATNSAAHVTALLACLAAGRTWVPLNPRNGKAELGEVLRQARPDLILCEDAVRDRLPDPTAQVLRLAPTRNGPAGPTAEGLLEDFAGRRPRLEPHDLGAVQAIKFTSGSSGKPKGVLQSYRSWNCHAACIAHAFGFCEDERFLAAAPITHGTSCFLLPVLAAGGCLVLPDSSKPAALLEAFAERGVTATYMTPTMIYTLLSEPGIRARRYPAMRHLIYSGAPMRKSQIREALEVFPGALETCYGQAEAPQIIASMHGPDFADPANHGSVGRAGLLVRIGILDPQGTALPEGETGEICVRGDLVAEGYLDNPEAEAEAFQGGWLHTGDLGRLDAQGRLWIEGRKKDIIISGGFNIYPKDVEDSLGSHPAVLECTVFGVEDAKWGEAVHAAVELRAGTAASPDELIDFVKASLDSVKAPKRVHLLESLPRNAVGKVMRRQAKALVTGETP